MISGFIVMRSHLVCPIPGLTQGPPWWHAHLSAMMDSGMTVSGRLAYIMGWHLLPPFGPSQILLVKFFGGSTAGPSCCEATHASVNRLAWSRWVVSSSGSLTF